MKNPGTNAILVDGWPEYLKEIEMRRAAKVDSNQPEIVEALRAIGASVAHIHMVGAGVPDLIVGYRGINYLFEVKDGSLSPSRRKLTPDEQQWHEDWRGHVHIIESVEDAYQAIGAV